MALPARSAIDIARKFISHEVDISDLQEWLTTEQWDAPKSEANLIGEIEVALVHFGDGYADAEDVRQRISTALENFLYVTVHATFHASVTGQYFHDATFLKSQYITSSAVEMRTGKDLVKAA